MTEKRFTIKPQNDLFGVVDNYSADKVCVINGIRTEIEAEWLCKDMNALNDENEQLKKDATILIYSNQEYRKENQKLKHELLCKRYIDDETHEWDILHLNEEDGWEHEQIRDRLHLKGIDCYSADIWFEKNMAFLLGVDPWKSDKVAEALGLHREVIYTDGEHQFMILNLYQEKDLREIEEVKQ